MNGSEWAVLRNLLIEKTNAGRLQWSIGPRCEYFEVALGPTVAGRVFEKHFILIAPSGATIAHRRFQYDGDVHVYEMARASAMRADEKIDEALAFLSNL